MREKLRNALEQRLLRRAEELLSDVADERREAAAEILGELASSGEEVAAAEARLHALRNRLAAVGIQTDDRLEQVERLVAVVAQRDQALRDHSSELAALQARADLAESQARTYASAVERLQDDLCLT